MIEEIAVDDHRLARAARRWPSTSTSTRSSTSVVFCALIDRVGKVSAHHAEAERLPADGGEHAADPRCAEEAFHLAAGVVPMRRWATLAARDDGFVTMEMLQQALNKWMPAPQARECSATSAQRRHQCARYGLKPLKNAEAAAALSRGGRGSWCATSTSRYLRARHPALSLAEAPRVLDAHPGRRGRRRPPRGCAGRGSAAAGARRGSSAAAAWRRSRMVGVERRGLSRTSMPTCVTSAAAPCRRLLLAHGRDYKEYTEVLIKVHSGEADGGGGELADAGPAPRGRRLPVLEVGAMGGRWRGPGGRRGNPRRARRSLPRPLPRPQRPRRPLAAGANARRRSASSLPPRPPRPGPTALP